MSERDELVARLETSKRYLEAQVTNLSLDVHYDAVTKEHVATIEAAIKALSAPSATAATEPVAWTTVLKMIERGMAVYKERHPKWWKRMDGTPILNDLPVVIATEICETTLYTAPQAAPVEAGTMPCGLCGADVKLRPSIKQKPEEV